MPVIRMKLVDLLTIISFSEPAKKTHGRGAAVQSKTIQHQITACPCQRIDEADLRVVREFLMNRNATRRDLEFALNMSEGMVQRRLEMLRESGIVEHLPGDVYSLKEEHCVRRA